MDRRMKIFVFAAILSMVLLFGFIQLSDDDSSATPTGDVKDGSTTVGQYSLAGYMLTIEATEPPVASTSVDLPTLDSAEKGAVTDLVIIGFTKDLSESFDSAHGYTNLRKITYQGTTSPNVGKWYYDYNNKELTVKANSSSDVEPTLSYFEMKSEVLSVYIEGFTVNLSSMFTSSEGYTNLDGNIYYKGSHGSNGLLWTYEMKTRTLTVYRSSTSSSSSPGNYNADNAPFTNKFFASSVLHAIYKDYTNNSNFLFSGLTSLTTLRAIDYTDYSRNGILTAASALPISELYYDSVQTVDENTASPIKTTLRVFSAPAAREVKSNSFQNGYVSLTTVNLPSVTVVGNNAFSGSSTLVDVDLSSADTLEKDAFYSCSALRNITLPYARVIGEEAFYNCSSLETVSLSTSLSTSAEIGLNAFRSCTSLTTVTLGANTTVGQSAFRDCINLTGITAGKILTIDLNAFRGCRNLSGPLEFTILTSINSNANDYPFRGCSSLQSVNLPSIISMGTYAFYGCSGLQSITISGIITSIPQYAFAKCESLDTVTLSGNIETLGERSFEECTSLTSINFPDSVKTIGDFAFYKSGLMTLQTNKVQTIGVSAFQESKIQTFIPGTELKTIKKEAFKDSLLESPLIFDTKLETIGESAFASLPITSITFKADSNATTFISIGKTAFSQCGSLTTIHMNDRVTNIGEEAFSKCYMLATVDMGTKVQSIGNSAFNDCYRLASVITFPVTLNEIGTNAFANSSIGGVIFNADCPLSVISSGAFLNCRSLDGTLIIPKNVTVIGDSAFNGDIALDELQFAVGSRISEIGLSAFGGCTSLTGTVSFPNSLTTIRDTAFRLTALTGISFDPVSSYLSSIENNSFRDCTQLTGVLILPNRLSAIGERAFDSCGLTTVILGQGTTSLGDYAFSNNPMRYVVIPNVENNSLILSKGLFQNCPLEEIHISSSVTKINPSTFDYTPEVSKTISIWFNGTMDNITFTQNCMKFTATNTTTVSVNVHADAASETKCNSLMSSGYASGMTSLTYIKESSARVDIQEKMTSTPVFTRYYAIYGGKVVLPYVLVGEGYGVVYYAVKDSYDNLLAIYASDDDYTREEVAGSGQIITMYPIGDIVDSIGLDFSTERAITDNGFIRNMTILTDSSGIPVTIDSQDAYYGKVVTVPNFRQSSTIITSELYFVRADTLSYQLDKNTTTIRVGYYFNTIVLVPEEVMVTVTFISRSVVEPTQVLLLSPFQLPPELNYMQVPDPGYTFGGWWSAPDGRGIKANDNTRFSDGQMWYAYFTPNSYTVTMTCQEPDSVHFDPWVMSGPYTIHRVGDSLYYTDSAHPNNTLMFDGSSVPGWHVETYENADSPGTYIDGDYGPLTRALNIDLFMAMNSYTLVLKFATETEEISPSYPFTINDWAITTTTVFHTNDVISGISYAMIENGLVMPAPISEDYAFTMMTAGNTSVAYENVGYVLYLENFEGQLQATITYKMEMGLYTIMFNMDDDTDTSFSYQHAIHVGQSFTMPSVTPRYTKSGYEFANLIIDGVSGTYVQRQSVELTNEMASHAQYCVVNVHAVWTPLNYTISFTMGSYTGSVEPYTDKHEGDTIVMPIITDYPGHRASAWHWYKGAVESDPFTVSYVLTKEIIDTYSDDNREIMIKVDWELKTYTLSVDPTAMHYNPILNITYNEMFTLWTCIDEHSYKRFLGWTIGDIVYGDASHVRLDDNMAAAGDANNDIIVFSLAWADIQYRIQYNLNGGDGVRPHDENYYVVNVTPLTLPEDTGEFYKYGYSFKGWTYSLDSPFVYENEKGIFEDVLADNSVDGLVTFYAIWLQKSYKIAYDLDGGRQGKSAPTNIMYGDAVIISNPTRVGYEFLGWTGTGVTAGAKYLSASGYRLWDGTSLVRTESFMDLCGTDGGTVIMKANWGQAEYTVSYNYNGGTGVVVGGQMQIKIGEVIQLPTFKDAFKNGYTYIGWGVDTVNPLAPNTILVESMVEGSTDNTLVLYAVWDPISYQVKYRYTPDYDYNTIGAEYGDTVYIPLLDRSGYTFRGWTIAGAGSDAYYSKDGTIWYRVGSSTVNGLYFKNLSSTSDSVVTFEAEWSANEYKIAYNANGGTGKPPVDTNTYKVGDPVTMKDYKSLIGTNGNKTIVGWSLEITGTAVNITEFTQGLCNVADATGTVNMYGVWVDDMCLVVVDLDGSSVSAIPAGWTENADGTYEKLVNYGTSTKEAMSDWDDVTLSKGGYSFSGWSYTDSIVLSTVNVTPTFEKVNTGIVYIFAGVIGVFAVGAIVLTRL